MVPSNSSPTVSPLSAPRSRGALRRGVLAAAAILAAALPLRGAQPCIDRSAPGALRGFDRRALVIPLDSLVSRYRDNTQAEPDTQFSDSFLLAAVSTFVRFQTARRVSPLPAAPAGQTADLPMASELAGEQEQEDSARAAYARLADSAGAQLIVVAYSCSLGYRVFQPDGWRNNAGPGYERPVQATGFARVHVQIRERTGAVVYECVGLSTVNKPLLYRMFNGRRMRARRAEALDGDVVKASQKLYAPPILRAVGRAVARAMPVR